MLKSKRNLRGKMLLGLLVPMMAFADISVKSPDGRIALSIDVQDNKPVYAVSRDDLPVISPSALGVKYGDTEYYNFDGVRSDGVEEIVDNYTLNHGKRESYINHYKEQKVTFTNSADGKSLTMVFRVYDDAVAFRYTLESSEGAVSWDNEQSEFNFNKFVKCWVQDSYDAGYSSYFKPKSWSELQKTTYQGYEYGYCVPMLVQTGNNDAWCLVTESAALSSLAASTIVKGETNGIKLEIVKHGNKLGTQETQCMISTPFESPWRTIIIGSLAEIVESTAVQNLSPATLSGDWSWVKPGRVAWNWAAEDSSNDLNSAMCRKYTDMAAHFGWEYNLLDEGWSGKLNVKDEVNYAKARGVGLILWFNQNHFGNDYNSIYTEMKKWADVGVKGFKIDFFEDDRQAQLAKYEHMLNAAKELKLVINFHGCTKPSGLDRTWPNLLTMEANYGGEMYMFWPHFTPSYHVVNLCLTRNVIGSMDYTPLKWGTSTSSIRSIGNNTWSQQLAMAVAFESGEFHPSDTPENLKYSVAEPLLKMLPVAWDDIKCLEAKPDQYVTLARKNGDNWWVATLANNARTATVTTDFLEPGKSYYAHIYRDGDYRYEVKSEVRSGITAGTTLQIPVLQYGGATVVFTTDAAMAFPHDRTYEAEYYNQGGTIQSDNRVFGGKYVANLNEANKLVFTDVVAQEAGKYAVTLYYRADSDTKAYVQANSEPKVQVSMPQPGVRANDHPGENIGFRTAVVDLQKGLNKLTIANNKGGSAPMVDHITVRPITFPAPQESDLMAADGKSFVNAQTVECESGSGDGLVQTDTKCSGGSRLNNLTAGKIRTYTINVAKAGVYDFHIYYMTAADRSIEVSANGTTVKVNCPSTGTWDGGKIKYTTASLYLKAGENTFTLGNDSDNSPNVDKVEYVLAAEVEAEEPVEVPVAFIEGRLDWATYLGVSNDSVKGSELIQRNDEVYVLAKDLDGVGGKRRLVAIVNHSDEQQQVIVSGNRLGYEKDFIIDGADISYALNVTVEAGETNVYILYGTRKEQTRFEAENSSVNDYENNGLAADSRFASVFMQDKGGQRSSNGYVIGQLGYFPTANAGAPANCYLQWNNVYSATGGDYYLTLTYYSAATTSAAVYVNGKKVKEFSNLNTGSRDAASSQTVKVTLQAGINSIKVGHTGIARDKDIVMPEVDFVDVVRAFNVSGDLTKTDYFVKGNKVMTSAKKLLYNQGTGDNAYQWSNHYQKGTNDSGGVESIWWQGYALATFAEYAKAARGTAYYDAYHTMVENLANLFPKFEKDIDGRYCWMMRPGYGHRFSDDDAWAGIGLLESYDLEHRQFYLDQLRMFGNWAWQLWDEKGGGGMYWQDAPASENNTLNVKNAANNNPTCIIFTRLYEITGEKVWLDRAILTYQWIYDVLLDKNDMQVRDNIAVKENNKMNTYKGAYNQGSFINAAVLLYRATGEHKYLEHAIACATSLNGRKFEYYQSPKLGKIRIAKADGDMLGRDVIVITRGYEELNKVIDNRTFINTIKNSMLNAYNERLDAECGLIKDGWKGNAGQSYDGKDDYYEGLIQLGFLEMFARLAMNEDYEWYAGNQEEEAAATTTVIEAENTTRTSGITVNSDALASNGRFVGFVGKGKSLRFNYEAPVAGKYQFVAYYCTNGARTFTLSVNGRVQTLNGVSTGSFGADTMSPLVVYVTLKEGSNRFIIDATGDAPNFDKFEITPMVSTSIYDVTVDAFPADTDEAIYNLNGQRVTTDWERLLKGIYIQRGKKILVK